MRRKSIATLATRGTWLGLAMGMTSGDPSDPSDRAAGEGTSEARLGSLATDHYDTNVIVCRGTWQKFPSGIWVHLLSNITVIQPHLIRYYYIRYHWIRCSRRTPSSTGPVSLDFRPVCPTFSSVTSQKPGINRNIATPRHLTTGNHWCFTGPQPRPITFYEQAKNVPSVDNVGQMTIHDSTIRCNMYQNDTPHFTVRLE